MTWSSLCCRSSFITCDCRKGEREERGGETTRGGGEGGCRVEGRGGKLRKWREMEGVEGSRGRG